MTLHCKKEPILVMCGASFSGKSTLAARIAAALDYKIVSLDEINLERGLRGGDGIPVSEWQRTHATAIERCERALGQDQRVLVDDTNCFRWLRDSYVAVAEAYGRKTLVVFLCVARNVILERWRENERKPTRHSVAETTMMEHLGLFESPSPDESFVTFYPDENFDAWLSARLVPALEKP